MSKFDELKEFYEEKADDIYNPGGLATYLSRKYGGSWGTYYSGITGKKNSETWNKIDWERVKARDRAKKSIDNDMSSILEDDVQLSKISPSLAGLLSAAAGWAMSDDIVRSGGGSPRGQMSPAQQLEWERMLRRQMRKKSLPEDVAFEDLQKHWQDSSDTYVRKIPIDNSLNISKDHAPVPPIMGEVWDAVKHRWTKPEHVGHTVQEVQGKKRIRGTGTGVHERTVGGHGTGKVRLLEAGRRYRSPADVGMLHPHERKRIGQPDIKPPTKGHKLRRKTRGTISPFQARGGAK